MVPVFHHPFTAIISAPSCSGKSTLAFNIIRHSSELVTNTQRQGFDAVFVLYRSWQPLYEQMRKELHIPIHFFEKTFPDTMTEMLSSARFPVILIDDGLCPENQREIQDLFTRQSHHLGVSVIGLMCL